MLSSFALWATAGQASHPRRIFRSEGCPAEARQSVGGRVLVVWAPTSGDRTQLKANRRLSSGGPVSNGEVVTVKSCALDSSLELTDGRILLLKPNHLIYAELLPANEEQRLTLFFTTHEVHTHGHALRRIEAGPQRSELSAISAGPRSFGSRPQDGQPVVHRIDVVEAETGEASTA